MCWFMTQVLMLEAMKFQNHSIIEDYIIWFWCMIFYWCYSIKVSLIVLWLRLQSYVNLLTELIYFVWCKWSQAVAYCKILTDHKKDNDHQCLNVNTIQHFYTFSALQVHTCTDLLGEWPHLFYMHIAHTFYLLAHTVYLFLLTHEVEAIIWHYSNVPYCVLVWKLAFPKKKSIIFDIV